MGCRVCVVFSHPSPETPTWPYKGYDYEARKEAIKSSLREALPGFDLVF